jgi:hypothetical protein
MLDYEAQSASNPTYAESLQIVQCGNGCQHATLNTVVRIEDLSYPCCNLRANGARKVVEEIHSSV